MKWATIGALLLTALSPPIPKENQSKGELPAQSSAEEGAKILLDAYQTGNFAEATPFFFPKDAFNLVKDLQNPERYHHKLMKWYEDDFQKERARFKSAKWTFSKLELGRCKWKEKGSEANKVAYWSCIGNFVTAVSEGKSRRFEIRTLINWGDLWYVTHLGPIRP